jgi:hypothetical protein
MAFIDSVEDQGKRADCIRLLEILGRLTGQPPAMWGSSIIGFGEYSYRTRDGKSHNWFEIGFSPRKQNLTLYLMTGFDQYEKYLDRLGKHRTSVSCLYVKRLADIDMSVLEEMLSETLARIATRSTDTGLIV